MGRKILKYILIVSALCASNNLLAQDFVYPLGVGDKWQLGQILFGPSLSYYYIQFQIIADSALPNGHTYVRFNDEPQVRRQQGNQVFMFSPVDNKEHVMYDFTRSIGDTVGSYPQGHWTFQVVLRDTGRTEAFGQIRRTFVFYCFTRDATDADVVVSIVDGIGVFRYVSSLGPFDLVGAVISGRSYGTIVDVPRARSSPPEGFQLNQNYPNPFNPSTIIQYDLPISSHVELVVYNVLGQLIERLIDGRRSAGSYSVQWNATVPSGIYFYRLHAGEFVETRKMIVLK